MKKFLYKAKNEKGQVVTGSVNAKDENEAQRLLTNHHFAVLEITPPKAPASLSFFQGKVSAKDKALFARQLSTMLSAGLELTKALKVTANQSKNEKLKNILFNVYKNVEEGSSFSKSLSLHPQAFDSVFISVVSAGEATGKIDEVLNELATQLENDNDFVGKVRGAMYYPAFILLAMVGIATYMMIKVIPQLKSLFESAGADLPIATRMLLKLSDFITSEWWLVIIILIGLTVGIRFFVKTESGRRVKDEIVIKTPGVKVLFEGMIMYRFTRTMSMLIGAGVPLLDALKIGGTTMNNSLYEESIKKIIHHVERGVPLNVQLSKDPIFPALVGQMAAVGEETGKLDQVFEKISDYYEESTGQAIKAISTLIEPVILVVMGCGVAFLVFAVLVPIYNLSQLQ